MDRLHEQDFSVVVIEHKENALLLCLQVLSDIIVHRLHPHTLEVKSPNNTIIRENESLIRSISQHNLKIERINKEIINGFEINEEYRDTKSSYKGTSSVIIDT